MIKLLKWNVVHWIGRWRLLWYKTANIEIKDDISLEKSVYRVNIIYDNQVYPWVWVYIKWKKIFEVHIFDFDKYIYDEEIEIVVLNKIRDMIDFTTKEDLVEAIENDLKTAKSIKNTVITFGTFDIIHPGHEYYLKEAKKYGDILITIISKDINVEKIKWKLPKNNENIRKKLVENLNISDEVILWNVDNPLFFLDKYSPFIICLWYDQKWFVWVLEKYLADNSININVLRIWSLEPDQYKSSLM